MCGVVRLVFRDCVSTFPIGGLDLVQSQNASGAIQATGLAYRTRQRKGDTMYAVVRTGGKQYQVAVGDTLEVEKLAGNVGESITLDDVLLVANGDNVTIGTPQVEGATVSAKITGQHRGDKILVFRYRPKKRIRVRRGHRQYLTRLQIESINA